MSKSLIIVESPAKARTLQKYLGKDFTVKASVGHIRDLPVKTLGVDVETDFSPQYVTIRGKSKILKELKSAAKASEEIFLAPDPDREGEAIAYHIAESLKTVKKPIHRVLFHELTKKAILAALENATEINYTLFEAQQARRILDRLVGYQISPLLWDKVRRGLSAGRVQSVAVRMICERERAIQDFVSEEYWSIGVALTGTLPPPFTAKVEKQKGKKLKIGNEAGARKIVDTLTKASYTIQRIDKKEKKRYPSPPFITSTMQMEANRKLRFSAKKTMVLAQKLYEGIELGVEGPTGLITYMRTDSTRINADALSDLRKHIKMSYGAKFLPAKPFSYRTGKSAQDAHEAVRPTDVSNTPEKMAPFLEKDMLVLYTLIWKRFVASQMSPAVFDQTSFQIKADEYQLKTVGSIMRFLGFMTLYVESDDDTKEAEKKTGPKGGKDIALPDLKEGDSLTMQEIVPKQHFTQPPPPYTEATLVKALEENGVGRPSTYASIISTIQDKEYVDLTQRKFHPTDLGVLVNDLLVDHFPDIMNVDFTASMEQNLDLIAEGKSEWRKVLKNFYGPFKKTLDQAKKEMRSVKRSATPTDIPCKLCDGMMVIKWGRMGEFLACENFPECKNTQDFKRQEDGTVEPIEREEPQESGEVCEKCGQPMVYKHGRYGKFLACSGYPECRHIKAQTTGVSCPNEGCDGEVVQKISKRGKVFYSCNRYPKCTFALWDKPVSEPCPRCGAPYLLEKETKKGVFLKCADKACGFSRTLEKNEEA
ncbi:MAG: type I DNA topoisomerase [Desulfobulbaceae bacterium]|nr:type I DNA topoisomerase [Desulfobulbaceae bacterium]MCK5403571.1 type I DNA topoisomerase [Desulfobulbaceae bacterium]